MKKLFILWLFVFNLTITSCIAASWVQLDDYNCIDKDSIKFYTNDYGNTNYNKRIFWIKNVGNEKYKDIEKMTKSKIEYGLAQYIVNYSNNTIATKSGMTYDKNGKIISSYSYRDFELKYESIAPNSNAEMWADLAKKPRALKRAYKYQQYNQETK